MAYDRYDPRQRGRDDRSRWSDDRFESRNRGFDRDSFRDRDERNFRDRDERGFFERAGDEIASWFGDDNSGGHHDRDDRMPERSHGRDRDNWGGDRDSWRGERSSGREREPWGGGDRSESYRPMTGDYGRSEGFFAAGGYPRGDQYRESGQRQGNWDRDDYRRTSFAGSSERSQRHDPHYHEWRQRQIEDLDRDYDDYRREHQSKFENEFGSWRERRQSKRQMLRTVREHMEVIGNDDEHVGTVDRVAGDRIILTKSDPESGGAHHSIACTDIDRIEENRVILDCSAEQAKQRWRDERSGRALFEREDQGEAGPQMLDRSFSGTYR